MEHSTHDPRQDCRSAWNAGRKLGAKRPLHPSRKWKAERLLSGTIPHLCRSFVEAIQLLCARTSLLECCLQSLEQTLWGSHGARSTVLPS